MRYQKNRMPCFWLRTIWDCVKVDSSAEADVAWVSVHDPNASAFATPIKASRNATAAETYSFG